VQNPFDCSACDLQEAFLAREGGQRQRRPFLAFGIAQAAVGGRHVGRVAQAHHAPDQQGARESEARRERHEARAGARQRVRRAIRLEVARQVDDAQQAAADVREAEIPRLRERHGGQRRQRHDLAGFDEVQQVAHAADLHAQLVRARAAARARGLHALEQLFLVLAQAGAPCRAFLCAGVAGVHVRRRARRSWPAAGPGRPA
jgi:hypothetical protein